MPYPAKPAGSRPVRGWSLRARSINSTRDLLPKIQTSSKSANPTMTRRIERGEEREKQVHEQEQQREELELELELEEILQQEERGGNKNGDRSILCLLYTSDAADE